MEPLKIIPRNIPERLEEIISISWLIFTNQYINQKYEKGFEYKYLNTKTGKEFCKKYGSFIFKGNYQFQWENYSQNHNYKRWFLKIKNCRKNVLGIIRLTTASGSCKELLSVTP